MTRPRRYLAAMGCFVFVCPALCGCKSSSAPGSGDKAEDLKTFRGSGSMPPEARAQMQAAMSHGRENAQKQHGQPGETGQREGQAQLPANMQGGTDKAQPN